MKSLSPSERIALIKSKYPTHMCEFHGQINGIWMVGNSYQGEYSGDYYGSYPHSYLNRVLTMFPDCDRILHLFSGNIKRDLTLDINKSLRPTLASDAENCAIRDDSIDLVIADPPYTEEDAKKYKTTNPSRPKVFTECFRILRPGGYLAWLDLLYPQFHIEGKFDFQLYGLIFIVISTNHRPRLLTLLKKPGELFTSKQSLAERFK